MRMLCRWLELFTYIRVFGINKVVVALNGYLPTDPSLFIEDIVEENTLEGLNCIGNPSVFTQSKYEDNNRERQIKEYHKKKSTDRLDVPYEDYPKWPLKYPRHTSVSPR